MVGVAGTRLDEASVMPVAMSECLFPISETKPGESGSIDSNIGFRCFLETLNGFWTDLCCRRGTRFGDCEQSY